MFGFSSLDLIVIVLYAGAVLAIGAWVRLRSQTQRQYFLGGQRFGKVIQTFAAFGQGAAPEGPVGVATATFHNGIAGVWVSLLMVFFTPFYWITSAWLRRLRIMTMGDFYVERYGSTRMGAIYAIVANVGMMSALSGGYMATAITTLAMTPRPAFAGQSVERQEYGSVSELARSEGIAVNQYAPAGQSSMNELLQRTPRLAFSLLSPQTVIWTICFITILNCVMGGLSAVFYTAALQSCCIVAISIILIPFGMAKINVLYGGHGFGAALASLHAGLPDAFFQVFGSNALPEFTWYYVAAVSTIAGVSVIVQPNQLVTNAAARDELSARVGMITGSFVKRICTILWAFAGLIAALLYGGSLRNSDMVWGYATRDLLGPVNLGLVGLMLVGMLSALMAASNSLMLTMSGLITVNLYRPLYPGKSEQHYVLAGRVAGVLFLTGSALIATQFDSLLDILKLNWEFFTIFSAAFWLGIKWRRANRTGAWASILVTASVFYVIPLLLPVLYPAMRSNTILAEETLSRDINYSDRSPSVNNLKNSRLVSPQSIFWSQGLALDGTGHRIGRGYPYLDLLLLRAAGFELRRNSFALNETIRLIIRMLVPFFLLVVIARLTPRDNEALLDRFFAKMRTRVISGGGKADSANVAIAVNKANHLQEPKIFPNSDWELYKWNRTDVMGFLLSVGFVIMLLVLLRIAMS